MDRTRYIPSIVSLAGGFVACLVTIVNSYDTLEMLFLVLAALIVFYIAGAIIRIIIKRVLVVPKSEDSETESEDGSEDEESENTEDEENTQDEDSSEENQEEE